MDKKAADAKKTDTKQAAKKWGGDEIDHFMRH